MNKETKEFLIIKFEAIVQDYKDSGYTLNYKLSSEVANIVTALYMLKSNLIEQEETKNEE
jgi:hypothetical protein